MKGRTKPKGFGIAATVLLASLLIAAVSAPASARGLGGSAACLYMNGIVDTLQPRLGTTHFFHFLQIRGY